MYIRQVAHRDLEPLHGVDLHVFGELAYPYFALRQLIDVHYRHFLVADAGPDLPGLAPELLGYVLAAHAAQAPEAWLLNLGVRPDMRRRGYGRMLFERCLAGLRRDGAGLVRLTVEPGNHAAIRLYESAGFRIQDLQRDYYGPGEHRYCMSVSLDSLRPERHANTVEGR
ncbi:GNAT family N-acetyltransferase [Actinospica durhamensis]|uniref:GNAT family N-acetyltransferase n=1 Tax=Actinospica durhamensis TaxID=1508375 RepID=A0A941ITF8_9ACTN|nr:N-acetyltransferase [Actinospica durhamensis]MBR7835933.1 GNAT family N-acetyltransferase [Actinospica durhamensis]